MIILLSIHKSLNVIIEKFTSKDNLQNNVESIAMDETYGAIQVFT